MKEFMLLFRQPSYDYREADPEKMKALEKKWQYWAGIIASKGKMVSNGNSLNM
jgi:hypothetical protein